MFKIGGVDHSTIHSERLARSLYIMDEKTVNGGVRI